MGKASVESINISLRKMEIFERRDRRAAIETGRGDGRGRDSSSMAEAHCMLTQADPNLDEAIEMIRDYIAAE